MNNSPIPFSDFPTSSPETLTRGGHGEGHEASSPAEKNLSRNSTGEDLCGYSLGTHLSPLLCGLILFFRFSSSIIHLCLFGCRLMGILCLLVGLFFLLFFLSWRHLSPLLLWVGSFFLTCLPTGLLVPVPNDGNSEGLMFSKYLEPFQQR